MKIEAAISPAMSVIIYEYSWRHIPVVACRYIAQNVLVFAVRLFPRFFILLLLLLLSSLLLTAIGLSPGGSVFFFL
jgi:hypothetical protein